MTGFDDWLAKKKAAPQSEKNNSLALAAENLGYEEVKALIAIGAKPEEATSSIPFLAWVLRKTDDFDMVNLLLDLNIPAKGVGFKDMWALLEEDRERAYTLMERMAGAGMEISERAKAAADAAKKGDFEFIERRLLQPGEDLVTLLDFASGDDKEGLLQKIAGKNEAEQALYKTYFASGMTSGKLQGNVNADGMTGFMLAIRAGKTVETLNFYRTGMGLDATAVLQEDQDHRRKVLVQERTPQQVRAMEVEYDKGKARLVSSASYHVGEWLPGSASMR